MAYDDDTPTTGTDFDNLDTDQLLGAVFDMAQRLGIDDLMGMTGMMDDDNQADELPTKQDVITDLTLILFYLTSWEEGPERGPKTRRAWKSADWTAIDLLREQGLIDCSNNAKSVYLTDEGVDVAEELLGYLDLDFLLDEDEDEEPANESQGWHVIE